MFDKLDDLLIRFEELMSELQEPDVANDQNRFRKLMKEQSLGMQKYYLALTARLTDMGLLNGGAMPEK